MLSRALTMDTGFTRSTVVRLGHRGHGSGEALGCKTCVKAQHTYFCVSSVPWIPLSRSPFDQKLYQTLHLTNKGHWPER